MFRKDVELSIMCVFWRLAPKQRTKTNGKSPSEQGPKVRWLAGVITPPERNRPRRTPRRQKKITSFSLCKGFSKKCLVKVDDINPGFNKDWSSNTKTDKTSKTSRKTIGSDFWVMGRTSFQELFLTWPCCKENNLLGRIHLQVKDDHSSERVMYGSPKKWPWHTENLRESHILMGFQTSRFRFPKGSPSAS